MMSIETTENRQIKSGNGQLAKQVLEELLACGVQEFCMCPGSRNAPLVYPLAHAKEVKVYYWSEERSAAFFALGRIKATGRPVAVVTTSGTAAAELLPATIEGYYTGLPLLLVTADRPRRFRKTGAPQSMEQLGLFSHYISGMQDLAHGDLCHLEDWTLEGPFHLNVCFEEPVAKECQEVRIVERPACRPLVSNNRFHPDMRYVNFIDRTRYPFVILGALSSSLYEPVIQYLLHLNAPVYAEGHSGVREDPRLLHLRITSIEKIWEIASQSGYPIDGILRIGGIPTARLWRDIESMEGQLPVCSISELPFSGLSCADVIYTSLLPFFKWACTIKPSCSYPYENWKKMDQMMRENLFTLFTEEPCAESSLVHELSCRIPFYSKVYLGNSLPIREWDQAATYEDRKYTIASSRGMNGIDGQLATFLGYCSEEQENWAILGDLTVLYDLVAPWVAGQLVNMSFTLVIVNNGGAGIFEKMYGHPAFHNHHSLDFKSLAEFWKWRYEYWESIPQRFESCKGGRMIELIPNAQSSSRFSKSLFSNSECLHSR